VCAHVDTFYQSTVSSPTIYWLIQEKTLRVADGFGAVEIVECPSDKGDTCHYDIRGVSEKKSENFAKAYCKSPAIRVCINGEASIISEQEYPRLADLYGSSK